MREDRLEVVLGHEEEPVGGDPEPFGSELDLPCRLLAGDVEHGSPALRERAARLEQQRGLADPRVPSDQDERALDEPPAEHPIQLTDPGRDALAALAVDRGEGQGPISGGGDHAHARPGRRNALLHELHVAARAGAVRTGAGFRGREPALLTAVHRTLARHQTTAVISAGPPRRRRRRCSSGSARAGDSSAARPRGTAPGFRTPSDLRARPRPSRPPP